MALLDDVVEANGGMTRWTSLKQFTLQLSINGTLLSRTGREMRLQDMVAEGMTQSQFVRIVGFTSPDVCGVYRPDRITIESLNGDILRAWDAPQFDVLGQPRNWDDLHLAFFCGLSIWHYLTTPFLLAQASIEVEELSPWCEDGQTWQRLRAVFPPDFPTSTAEQIFYFDSEYLQRRTDHDLFGSKIAHYSWAHQKFGDIVIPTLRRSLELRPDGTTVKRPPLLDLEIFDATFC